MVAVRVDRSAQVARINYYVPASSKQGMSESGHVCYLYCPVSIDGAPDSCYRRRPAYSCSSPIPPRSQNCLDKSQNSSKHPSRSHRCHPAIVESLRSIKYSHLSTQFTSFLWKYSLRSFSLRSMLTHAPKNSCLKVAQRGSISAQVTISRTWGGRQA